MCALAIFCTKPFLNTFYKGLKIKRHLGIDFHKKTFKIQEFFTQIRACRGHMYVSVPNTYYTESSVNRKLSWNYEANVLQIKSKYKKIKLCRAFKLYMLCMWGCMWVFLLGDLVISYLFIYWGLFLKHFTRFIFFFYVWNAPPSHIEKIVIK